MRKPTFLFINLDGDFLGIQMKVQAEGFKTIGNYESESCHRKHGTGKGLVETTKDVWKVLNEFKDTPDDLIVLIDDNSMGGMGDFLRSKGFPVIGASCFADEMEYDRHKGADMAESVGLNTPPSHSFTDFSSGLAFLDKQDPSKKFVFKPDGAELAGGAKTYPAKNVSDVRRFIEWVQKDQSKHNYQVDKFELQEVIDGVEVDMAHWFNGHEFTDTQIVTFEQKKTDGLGPAQGCMGQVMTFIPKSEPYATYFRRLEDKVTSGGPTEWGINAIVSSADHEPYFLEWTPRFGWDATLGELALLQDAGIPISQFLIRLAYNRTFGNGWFPIGRYSATVRLFSEYPGTEDSKVAGKPLWVDPSVEKNVWFYGVKKDEDQEGYIVTDNCIGVVTACGDTAEEAIAAVYAIVDPKNMLITTPDIYYSKCIGDNVPDSIRKLKDWGIMNEY